MNPTLEQVIEWAKGAGIEFQSHIGIAGRANVSTCGSQPLKKMELFSALAYAAGQAAEREACAKVCEQHAYDRFNERGTREHDTGSTYYQGAYAEELEARDEECHDLAAAIRARGAK